MFKKIFGWLFGSKIRKVPLAVYPARRRGMLSFGIQKDSDETPPPAWGLNPGTGSGGSCDYSPVNLGREFRDRPRAEEDGEIESLRRKIAEREDFAEEWDEEIEFKNPYG